MSRQEVVEFYATYDRQKKGQAQVASLKGWPWDDPDALDRTLDEHGLKKGVLAAYRSWCLVEIGLADVVECAIVNHIFRRESQVLGRLALRGKLAEWTPTGSPSWWREITNGSDLGQSEALILRPAVAGEAPAAWYAEDGSGRALALLQRILRHAEVARTAWAYVGHVPDERSAFIKGHPELKTPSPKLGGPDAEQ